MNTTPLQELIDEIGAGCADYYELLTGLVFCTRPKHVLELGTGTGVSGAAIMRLLPDESTFTTINWSNPPSGDEVGRELVRWKDDPRLTQILGDTRDVAGKMPDASENYPIFPAIDLLFIDSTHDYGTIAAEWALYSPKLADGALVCVDDLDFPGGGVRRFWDGLGLEKVETGLSAYGFGVARWRRGE